MPQDQLKAEEVVLGEEINHVRLITLNRPRQLNVISSRVVELLAKYLEKWEKDDDAELVIFKGAGRAFCAGGDLKMFYQGKTERDPCLEVVYRMYWLCYHMHTYKKTTVSLANGIVMGGGAAMLVPMKFSAVTEKTVFAVPEASIGLHVDCSFSYILSRLPGHLGEYLALTGARLNGKEMVAAGLVTHFVPSENLQELEKGLLSLNSGDETAVRKVIEDFSSDVQPDDVLHKLPTINKCFCKETVEDIIEAFEVEGSMGDNKWIAPVLEGLKKSSPTSLKIVLRSIREGRKQTLPECLKKEFRLTINITRSMISGDLYEGIRALAIDKDNAPKWEPATLGEVNSEKVDLVFQPFSTELELKVPADGEVCKASNEKVPVDGEACEVSNEKADTELEPKVRVDGEASGVSNEKIPVQHDVSCKMSKERVDIESELKVPANGEACEVSNEKVDLVFDRWGGKYENSVYPELKKTQ